MKSLFFFALAAGASAKSQTTTNPLAKVIEMLTGIQEQQKTALQDDQKTFSEYTNWCDDTVKTMQMATADASTEIERLTASQNEHEALASDLGEQIAVNNANIDRWTSDKKAARKVRSEERAKYMAAHQDLAESIAAMGAAMDSLRSENDKDAAGGSNQLEDGMTVYESQSGGIREILEDLQTKFQEDLHNKDVEEQEAVDAFDTLMQLLDQKLNEEGQMLDSNKESRAENMQKAAYAKGEAERLTAQVEDDTKYQKETEANCKAETSAFEQREKTAQDELEAIGTALEMLNNPDTATGHEHTVLAQLRSTSTAPNEKAIAYLNQMSKKLGSTTLAAVAVSAKADVFGKVIGMIKELIARLGKEAAGDLKHHSWCLENLAQNEKVRNKKTEEVEAHSTEKQRLIAIIEKKSVEAQTLTKEMTDLDTQRREQTKIRSEQSADNTKVISESEAALPLVQDAITTLREFYDNLGGDASLMSTNAAPGKRTEAPQLKPTSPAAAGAGGVVSLMEHVAEELSATITDTKVLEKKQSSDHEQFLKDNEETHHKKDLAEEQAQREKAQAEEDKTDCNTDLKDAQEQLTTALGEFKDSLTPQCIKTQSDPAERIEKRKQEIAALETALEILRDE